MGLRKRMAQGDWRNSGIQSHKMKWGKQLHALWVQALKDSSLSPQKAWTRRQCGLGDLSACVTSCLTSDRLCSRPRVSHGDDNLFLFETIHGGSSSPGFSPALEGPKQTYFVFVGRGGENGSGCFGILAMEPRFHCRLWSPWK